MNVNVKGLAPSSHIILPLLNNLFLKQRNFIVKNKKFHSALSETSEDKIL